MLGKEIDSQLETLNQPVPQEKLMQYLSTKYPDFQEIALQADYLLESLIMTTKYLFFLEIYSNGQLIL